MAEPFDLGGKTYGRLHARVHNFDPTLAPEGRTVIICMLEADEPYWGHLRANDRERYEVEKQRVANVVVPTVDRR